MNKKKSFKSNICIKSKLNKR